MLNQLNLLSARTCSPESVADTALPISDEQLGVVVVHQRRNVPETVVNHVRLRA